MAGGFDAAKRGKISFAETQQLAQDLGMTADDLLARRKGQAFSAEEAYAARAILAKSGNELVTMAKRLRAIGEDPGSEALSTFRKAMVRHAAIQEQVSGMTAEAGRALSAFRMAADSRDVPGRILEGLANSGGSSRRLKEAADAIIDLEAGPDILSPIWTTADRNDPITKEALRVGATITPPKKGELTGEQFDKLQPVIGTLARKWIGDLMTSPDYQQKDREEQAKDIGHVMEAARKEAKAHVLGGEPLDDERPEKKRKGSKRATGLPDGFALDPLPPGFVLDR